MQGHLSMRGEALTKSPPPPPNHHYLLSPVVTTFLSTVAFNYKGKVVVEANVRTTVIIIIWPMDEIKLKQQSTGN